MREHETQTTSTSKPTETAATVTGTGSTDRGSKSCAAETDNTLAWLQQHPGFPEKAPSGETGADPPVLLKHGKVGFRKVIVPDKGKRYPCQ